MEAGDSEILRLQSGMFGDPGKHSRTNLISVVEGEHKIGRVELAVSVPVVKSELRSVVRNYKVAIDALQIEGIVKDGIRSGTTIAIKTYFGLTGCSAFTND